MQVAEAGGNSVRVWVHVEGDSRWVVDVDVDSRWMVEMFGVDLELFYLQQIMQLQPVLGFGRIYTGH